MAHSLTCVGVEEQALWSTSGPQGIGPQQDGLPSAEERGLRLIATGRALAASFPGNHTGTMSAKGKAKAKGKVASKTPAIATLQDATQLTVRAMCIANLAPMPALPLSSRASGILFVDGAPNSPKCDVLPSHSLRRCSQGKELVAAARPGSLAWQKGPVSSPAALEKLQGLGLEALTKEMQTQMKVGDP